MGNIGEKIKKKRSEKKLKQYELAKLADMSNTFLSDIETGRSAPVIKTLEKIAKALEIDIKEFF
ncbi:anaerobic benzoate catabolism transcriptional regulator [Clostridium puniceum]|uniref:Anaerobic benzoate catabolism transcriptional regulator n=1 Tax=Clostridium puniceum TaxID=29367 RepID=A0A1S8SX08_9CLOT|nr:helix-turn-helix transcriptional regulator [Clostridium puniceum]OOM70018.1 anaerobic benzoate catabolism transcriptional regulator [Clostridium puniceum]